MNKPSENPKILHRIYFDNFAPFYDPFEHYLETWHREMPEYKVMKWGINNLDVRENEWTKRAFEEKAPVFLAEYFRWKVLSEYGGIYLDADCEIINGPVLSSIIDQLYNQDEYDVFFGVEERGNGHPTAQTIGAKKGADLVSYMKSLYDNSLAPLWHWRETRGLIGPQLMSLYFRDKGVNVGDDGFFKNLDDPLVVSRAKVYPQRYFSPKFTLVGDDLDYREGETCVYHMFANSNIDFSQNKRLRDERDRALTFSEYRSVLEKTSSFPRHYMASHFQSKVGSTTETSIVASDADGVILFGPYFSLPRGDYTGVLKFQNLPKHGKLSLSVTQDAGQRKLAGKKIRLNWFSGNKIEFAFTVDSEIASNVEVVLKGEVEGMIDFRELVVDRVSPENTVSAHSHVKSESEPEKPVAVLTDVMKPARAGSLKILHRVYFGFDGKPDQFQSYLETWRRELPDFEIMEWNASNLPMDINPYVGQLYAEKDHAFLTDYFRWHLLKEYGGSYLDADVEIVNGNIYRDLIEELETSTDIEAFIGIDEKSGGWYTAHSMASKPNSDIANFMCDLYANFGPFSAWRKKGLYFWAPQLVGLYFANRGHNKDGMGTSPHLSEPQVTSGVKIYPQEWFAPLAPGEEGGNPFKLNAYTSNSCLCHHFACSWHDADSPYVAYSKERGGQANVLLKELVDRKLGSAAHVQHSFDASSSPMRTAAGVQTSLGIETTGSPGHLCFGPYISLRKGAYEIEFNLAEIAQWGEVKLDVAASDSIKPIMSKRVRSSDIKDNSFRAMFAVSEDSSGLEFRLHVSAQSKFILRGLSVRRVSADPADFLRFERATWPRSILKSLGSKIFA